MLNKSGTDNMYKIPVQSSVNYQDQHFRRAIPIPVNVNVTTMLVSLMRQVRVRLTVIHLGRWRLHVRRNPNAEDGNIDQCDDAGGTPFEKLRRTSSFCEYSRPVDNDLK